MKKVFSVKKFERYMLSKIGYEHERIELSKKTWANGCDGKTEEEMLEIGLGTCDDWMIEVEDQQ